MTAEMSALISDNGGYVVWAQAAFGDMAGWFSGVNGCLANVFDLALYPALVAQYAGVIFDFTSNEVWFPPPDRFYLCFAAHLRCCNTCTELPCRLRVHGGHAGVLHQVHSCTGLLRNQSAWTGGCDVISRRHHLTCHDPVHRVLLRGNVSVRCHLSSASHLACRVWIVIFILDFCWVGFVPHPDLPLVLVIGLMTDRWYASAVLAARRCSHTLISWTHCTTPIGVCSHPH